MLVKSTRYPELRVVDAGVRFRGGEAEVTDAEALKVLRGLARLGVEVPDSGKGSTKTPEADGDAEPPKRKPGRPKKAS